MSEIDNTAAVSAEVKPPVAPLLNLSQFKPVDLINYEVLVPGTATPTGWVINLNGPSSPKARAYQDEQSKRSLNEARAREQQQLNGKKVSVEHVTVEQQRERNARWVASRIEGWTPIAIPEISGDAAAAVPYTDENAVKMLMHPNYAWVLLQLVETIGDDQRFTPASAKK